MIELIISEVPGSKFTLMRRKTPNKKFLKVFIKVLAKH